MNKCLHTELSSHEGTRGQFNGGTGVIKLGIDVHQEFYVVVCQEGGGNPKPAQRFKKEAFVSWAAKLKEKNNEIHAVYEACGFGFGLQRQLTSLGIACYVVCPQKLDEGNKRVKTDGVRRPRLGRFFVPLPSDRIDQMVLQHFARKVLDARIGVRAVEIPIPRATMKRKRFEDPSFNPLTTPT